MNPLQARRRLSRRAATLTLAVLLPLAAGPAPARDATVPPVAEVRDVPTTLHGTVVHDPYRWMEDVKSPASQAWLKGQGAAARSVLDRIDGREAINKRLVEVAAAQGDSVYSIQQMPGARWYYLKRGVGERQYKLVLRQGLTGKERVLVDPEVAGEEDRRAARDQLLPRLVGRQVPGLRHVGRRL